MKSGYKINTPFLAGCPLSFIVVDNYLSTNQYASYPFSGDIRPENVCGMNTVAIFRIKYKN